ncbi:hypothetical protein GDI0298 [Gluconacetobacter diazotrophicus PA1 5]|uniref:Uncharacterized protein n=1 Tax=Gluconacetobacter diazotrophicus (strain ATCC 49037 / DSM 5601 / CCUG 37298 / CIP 103539 / LMG 7603 / PAl5) TaxID=272568 RepID=A9H355_GLUDA|nr:hypothetical protein GDI0298 [Gluconacetobacter diazotrophicus PA1 5]
MWIYIQSYIDKWSDLSTVRYDSSKKKYHNWVFKVECTSTCRSSRFKTCEAGRKITAGGSQPCLRSITYGTKAGGDARRPPSCACEGISTLMAAAFRPMGRIPTRSAPWSVGRAIPSPWTAILTKSDRIGIVLTGLPFRTNCQDCGRVSRRRSGINRQHCTHSASESALGQGAPWPRPAVMGTHRAFDLDVADTAGTSWAISLQR